MVKKGFAKRIVNWRFNRKFMKIKRGWRKIVKANGAVHRGVLLAVEVALPVLRFTVLHLVVVVVKKVVYFFQGDYLKDQYCQQEGSDLAIYGAVFQINLSKGKEIKYNRHYLEKLCKCPAGLKLGGNFKLPPNFRTPDPSNKIKGLQRSIRKMKMQDSE